MVLARLQVVYFHTNNVLAGDRITARQPVKINLNYSSNMVQILLVGE